MAYTSDYADGKLSKYGNTAKAIKKEEKHRTKATKATLTGKPKKAARQGAKADKARRKMSQ